MVVCYLFQFCIVMTFVFYNVTEAAWILTGSSEFAVTNRVYVLTCKPDDNGGLIVWRRSGSIIAIIEYNNRCDIQNGSDQQYQYTCEPGPVYKLTIPANVMTSSQNNIVWRCGSTIGGAGNNAEYTLKIAVPVSSVNIQGESGYPAVNVLYENTPKSFTCITNGCRPKANITVTTTGVTQGQMTEGQSTQSDGLIVTTVTQTITATRGDTLKTFQCSAVNIQGKQPVTSQTFTLDVYYIPSVEPKLSGYTTGTVLYEVYNSLRITCQQSGGYPLSVISWSCNGQTGTPNSSGKVASSYIQLTVNRNLNRKTCTCIVRHPYITTYTRTTFVTFTVYYPPTSPTLQISGTSFPWAENTKGVLRCTTTPGNPPETKYDWIRNSEVINGQITDTYTIPTLSYVHDGLRIQCRVSNVYTVHRPPAKVSNITVLDVQFSAKFDPKEEAHKLGELHQKLTINITFYSNPPAVITNIKWINKTSGNSLTNSDSISIKLISTVIQRIVYGKLVTLNGQSAMLIIASLQSFHLGHYRLQIQNGGNLSSSFDFQINTSAAPEAPSEFSLAENGTKSVKLKWMRGFNGGNAQTFVIRYTNTFTQETEETKIDDTNQDSNYTVEIDELEPDTTYHFWIYSTNEKGNSTLSDNLIVQTLKEPEPDRQTVNIRAIAGGITGTLVAIIIIVVIGGVIFYRRRTRGTKRNDNRRNGKFPLTVRDQSYEEDRMCDNVLYEPAVPTLVKPDTSGRSIGGISGDAAGDENDYPYAEDQTNGKSGLDNHVPVYAEVQKKPKNEKKPYPSAVFADVQKPKKIDKEGGAKPKTLLGKPKEKKAKPGKFYENMDDINAEKKDDKMKKPKAPTTKTKLNKNKDGLIYADILHEGKPNGESRPVIYGLENKTDYAEVDLSRSGKPLPPDNSQPDKQEQANK